MHTHCVHSIHQWGWRSTHHKHCGAQPHITTTSGGDMHTQRAHSIHKWVICTHNVCTVYTSGGGGAHTISTVVHSHTEQPLVGVEEHRRSIAGDNRPSKRISGLYFYTTTVYTEQWGWKSTDAAARQNHSAAGDDRSSKWKVGLHAHNRSIHWPVGERRRSSQTGPQRRRSWQA